MTEIRMIRVVATFTDPQNWHPALLRAAKAEGATDVQDWLMGDLAAEIKELVRDFVEKHSEAISGEPDVVL